MADDQPLEARLAALEAARKALLANWPAHSVPPALLARLDDLEEAIAALRDALAGETAGAPPAAAPPDHDGGSPG